MTHEEPVFSQLEKIVNEQDISVALAWLVDHFRTSGEHHQLFETRKMQVRHGLGLSLLYRNEPDQLDEPTQRSLEDGLLEVCREVGTLLFKKGELREGWMYLQPVGDRELNESLLKQIEVNDDNRDTIIEVALHEGAAPEYGYAMLLEGFGTCNAITTFDTHCIRFDSSVRQNLAALLVVHLYKELVNNIRNHIEQHEKSLPESESLNELLQDRQWLTEGGNHHVDTTHLASLMRIGRIVHSADELGQLHELTRYGAMLSSDFHYQGDPPFEDCYRDHGLFYRALVTDDPEAAEAAIKHFEQKTKTVDRAQYGAAAVETLVDLLCRLGRNQQALEVYTEQLYRQEDLVGIAPNIFDIAKSPEEISFLTTFFRSQNDLLGFSVGLLSSKSHAASGQK